MSCLVRGASGHMDLEQLTAVRGGQPGSQSSTRRTRGFAPRPVAGRLGQDLSAAWRGPGGACERPRYRWNSALFPSDRSVSVPDCADSCENARPGPAHHRSLRSPGDRVVTAAEAHGYEPQRHETAERAHAAGEAAGEGSKAQIEARRSSRPPRWWGRSRYRRHHPGSAADPRVAFRPLAPARRDRVAGRSHAPALTLSSVRGLLFAGER